MQQPSMPAYDSTTTATICRREIAPARSPVRPADPIRREPERDPAVRRYTRLYAAAVSTISQTHAIPRDRVHPDPQRQE
jgi:hypothetical protein